jgi:hypothetical protein
MGKIAWFFKEFKVKSIRLPDGGVRLHVIPLDGENRGGSYTWYHSLRCLIAERYRSEILDELFPGGYYVDDVTITQLRDPSWYLQYFNEALREWMRANGPQLYEEMIPESMRPTHPGLAVMDRVLVYHSKPLSLEEACENWVRSVCSYVYELEEWYREGGLVIYAEDLPRTALDWWLYEEALTLEIWEEELWSLKAKDREFEEWWIKAKEEIYRYASQHHKPEWLVALDEVGIKIRERFRGLPSKGEGFTFDVETVLDELAADPKWSERVEAYRMYSRGMFQDDIKKAFGVAQSTISKWISRVQGELSRRMGKAYEHYRREMLLRRPDVERVVYDGRKGRPDFIVILRDGSIEVISSKCYYSDRRSVSIKREELEPEIREALRLRDEGRRVRLLVDFYNLHDGHHEMREIPLDSIPPCLLFHHT